MDASKAFKNSRVHRSRDRRGPSNRFEPTADRRPYHHSPTVGYPPPPPGVSIPEPYDVTPLRFSNDNAYYRDALDKWHYYLISAGSTERWSFTVLWFPMSSPGSDIKLQAMVQLDLDSSGMSCSPFSCPVYYKILGINQILEVCKYHDIPRKIQDMFSPSDRAKADKQALHDKIDDLISISSNRSGSDETFISGTRGTNSNVRCILASIYAEPEKWTGFLREAIQSGSKILSAQSHTEAISAHSSTTKVASTLDN
jgi:hypothetical protein